MTFDFGQTLASLDHELLAKRAEERGVRVSASGAARATPGAWLAYNAAKRAGLAGRDAWRTFMREVLRGGAPELDDAVADPLTHWLFDQQAISNLWRKPVPGMIQLARELASSGVPVAVISNSEGRLAALTSELGFDDPFRVVADSGVLGIEKPDAGIFTWTAAELGVEVHQLVQVGDAWDADVVGALGVGARAIWFDPADARNLPRDVAVARDARETRAALAAWGLLT